MDRIREIGFRSDLTGYEGLSWYTQLRNEGHLDENNNDYVPSYCFNWSDPHEVAGHKQSGDINNPDNFNNHKNASGDYAKRPLICLSKDAINAVYAKYYKWLQDNKTTLNSTYYNKYYEQSN
jgi:hypothetical protein